MSIKNTRPLHSAFTRRQFIGIAGTAALASLLPSGMKVVAQEVNGQKIPLTPDWRIVVATKATKPEIFAAEELQHYIQKLLGYSLKIETSDTHQPGKAFLIGRHPALKEYSDQLDQMHGARPDSFALIARPDFIGMVGASKIATCHAVWHWLEALGVRWFFPTPRGEYVPELAQVTTDGGDFYFTPDINMRWAWPWVGGEQKKENAFGELEHGIPAWNLHQSRLRVWDNTNYISPEDAVGNIGYGHSYFRFLPAEKYYEAHPEWFNLLGGKRVRTEKEGVQVCFTNQDGAKEFAKNLLAAIANSTQDPRRLVVFVSPNDARAWCECANCQKLVDKDGSATSMVVNFTNLVAREVAQTHPQLLLQLYAYWNHSTPPDHVLPDSNVAIILTHWPSADSFHFNNTRPGLSPEGNPKFFNAYRRWNELSKNISVYQYYGHFIWWTPWPMTTQMDTDLKKHVQNPNFRGYCCEYRTHWANQGLGMYVLAKLSWDAKQDVNALLADYCQKAFGPASDFLTEYYQVLQRAMDAAPYVAGDFWELRAVLTPKVIEQCDDLVQKARAALPQMDDGTRWRTDLVTKGWQMSSHFGRGINLFFEEASLANIQKIRAHYQAIKDFLARDEQGVYLMETQGTFNHYVKDFLVPLEALPAGKHVYVDKANYGGASRYYAQIEGIITSEWGHRLAGGARGSYRITVKAAPGHKLKDFKVTAHTLGNETILKYQLSATSANGTHNFEGTPLTNREHVVPANLLDCPELTFHLQIHNVSSSESFCLQGWKFEIEVV